VQQQDKLREVLPNKQEIGELFHRKLFTFHKAMYTKELRENKGLTQQELADKAGIPRDRIAKWEQGKGAPKMEDVLKLQKIFGKDYGEELPIPMLEEPEPFLVKRRNKKNSNEPYLVPFVDIPAQAGYAMAYQQRDYQETLKKYPILPDVDPTGAVWHYFQIEGDSMEPEFRAGDVILCSLVPKDDWTQFNDYHTYVIVTHDHLWIKDVFKDSDSEWILLSQNEHHKPFKVQVKDVKQLWVMRRHVKARAKKHKLYDINAIRKDLKK
jgi:phage repressor protein C with HTH and peptisase S24 domain